MKPYIIVAILLLTALTCTIVGATTHTCVDCSDCNAKIQNADYGDVVMLTADITNHDGDCIEFNGTDGVTFDCGGHTIEGDGDFDGSGIYLSRDSDDNRIKNCEISDFRSGIYLFCSSNNTLQNLTSYSNDDGIKILYGDSNTVRDSVAHENDHYDFYFRPNVIGDCNNRLINVTGSGGRPIGFYNQSVNLQDQEFSALYLCNADNSILNNITIRGSDSLNNNGLRMFYTDNLNLTDITSSHNFEGILLDDDTCSNTLRNIRCNDNHHQGIMVQYGSDHNRLEDVETRSNGQCGIYPLSCSLNNLTGVTSDSNGYAGIYVDRSFSTIINNSHITYNHVGINIGSSGSNQIYNNYFCNDEEVWIGGTEYTNIWNVTNCTGPNIVGKPFIGGNYWSDYSGLDNNSDGFGDTPYNVNGAGESNIDYLPLFDPPDIRIDPTTLNIQVLPATGGEAGYAETERIVLSAPPRSQPDVPVDRILVDGRPPDVLMVSAAELPKAEPSAGTNVLSEVPAFDWCYGCSATAAAMLAGYYDNNGYPDMYTGPANDGVCPLNNSVWGYGECPLSATHREIDGRAVRGHVEDYWVSSGMKGTDPYAINGWEQHTWRDCTADFMGTSQDKFGAAYGGTWFWFNSYGEPLYDYYAGTGEHDGCYGLRRFVESRGYIVLENFNQYIRGYKSDTKGFTFENFTFEIDAGRPVIIQVSEHSMLGLGYDNSTGQKLVYLHDTWNHNNHTMTWGGSYSGLQHYGVTVIRLAPADHPVQTGVFSIIEDDSKPLTIDSINKNESWIELDHPAIPFSMVGYGQRAVIVRVDGTEAASGDSDTIMVGSNDPDESPYPGGVAVAVWRCGDVDGSGTVNILDARLLLNHIHDPDNYPVNECAGNVNGEGGIDTADVRMLLAYTFDPTGHLIRCTCE